MKVSVRLSQAVARGAKRLSFALLLALLGSATPVLAAPILVDVQPEMGAGSPLGQGWTTLSVRLRNPEKVARDGVVEVQARPNWAREKKSTMTRAPFALAPGAEVVLELPVHGFATAPADFELRVFDQDGKELAQAAVPEFGQKDPLVLDLDVPSRLLPALRGMGTLLRRHAGGAYRAPAVTVAVPPLDPKTGDPHLPRWPAGYANATLVTVSGARLSSLDPSERQALADWVLAGGSLGVTVERPEDLRIDLLARLTGGVPELEPPPSSLLGDATFLVPTSSPGFAPHKSRTPYGPKIEAQEERLSPRPGTAHALASFRGNNLRPSPWGAVASYGLGEVHLFAFRLDERFLADRWTQLKVVDLVRHTWERQAQIALPLGQSAFDGYSTPAIRRVLDPNQTMRWTVVAASLLLLVYATVAGPVNFWLASRKGHPLRALARLPIIAGLTLAVIVLVGVLGRGTKGRARRVSLVEAGAGMGKAAATRFRGLYSSSSAELTVQPTARSSLLDVVTEEEHVERTLLVDRDGTRLTRLRTRPWETLVVREDGFTNLSGGVSMVLGPGGVVTVRNRTARDLVGVILKPPNGGAVSFARIKDGQAVTSSDGNALSVGLGGPGASPFARPLLSTLFASELDRHVENVGAAWQGLEAYAGTEVDWWPPDVPVLIAQLDGGEGKLTDSGLEVEIDRVLLRVVGFGGVP
jgi:hypothetical protein